MTVESNYGHLGLPPIERQLSKVGASFWLWKIYKCLFCLTKVIKGMVSSTHMRDRNLKKSVLLVLRTFWIQNLIRLRLLKLCNNKWTKVLENCLLIVDKSTSGGKYFYNFTINTSGSSWKWGQWRWTWLSAFTSRTTKSGHGLTGDREKIYVTIFLFPVNY